MKKLTSLLLTAMMTSFSISAYTMEEALPQVEATQHLYLIGNATPAGWNTGSAPELALTDGKATWNGKLIGKDGSDTPRFKFLIDGKSWDISLTSNCDTENVSHTTVTSGEETQLYVRPDTNFGKDNAFQVEKTGIYTISVDLPARKMICTLESEIIMPDIYMTGGATTGGWTTNLTNLANNSNRLKLTLLDNNHYTWTGQLYAANTNGNNDGRFRFICTDKWWDNGYTTVYEETGSHEIGEGEYAIRHHTTAPAHEPAFKIMETGIYTIDIDIENNVMNIERSNMDLYILGDATETGWDLGKWNALPLEKGENHTYTWTGNMKPGTFRFAISRNWWPSVTTAETSNPTLENGDYAIKMVMENGRSFSVVSEGNYTLTLDLVAMSLNVKANGEIVVEPEKLYICGSALTNYDIDWITPERIQEMTPTENPHEFSWTGEMFYAAGNEFKFRNKSHEDGSWDGWVSATDAHQPIEHGNTYAILPTSEHQDFKFLLPEGADGKYNIVANTEARTMKVTKMSTDGIEAAAAEANGVKVMGNVVMAEGVAVVYDAMGRTVGTIANGSLTLPAAGIYVVVANGTATKIAVK